MDSGKLNKRIVIKRQSKTSDGYGGTTSTLTTVATIWARVKELKGEISKTEFASGRYIEVEIIVRSQTADQYILANDIIQFQGETGNYKINNIYESQEDQFVKILATKFI
jgi:SPP1 family predicted phage head-tail adaptor